MKVSKITDQQVVTIIKAEEPPKEVRKEHFVEATKSLTCPTCGKVKKFEKFMVKKYQI